MSIIIKRYIVIFLLPLILFISSSSNTSLYLTHLNNHSTIHHKNLSVKQLNVVNIIDEDGDGENDNIYENINDDFIFSITGNFFYNTFSNLLNNLTIPQKIEPKPAYKFCSTYEYISISKEIYQCKLQFDC